MKVIRDAKMREEMQDREASLRRAKEEAYLADGISWGMGEDAVEEEEVCDKLLFLMMLAALICLIYAVLEKYGRFHMQFFVLLFHALNLCFIMAF